MSKCIILDREVNKRLKFRFLHLRIFSFDWWIRKLNEFYETYNFFVNKFFKAFWIYRSICRMENKTYGMASFIMHTCMYILSFIHSSVIFKSINETYFAIISIKFKSSFIIGNSIIRLQCKLTETITKWCNYKHWYANAIWTFQYAYSHYNENCNTERIQIE